ncbi:MAG: DUF4493 domain-containing protein [Candidatus Coprenecus sp.]
MKKIYIFIIASAALLLSSCSIDSKKGFGYLSLSVTEPEVSIITETKAEGEEPVSEEVASNYLVTITNQETGEVKSDNYGKIKTCTLVTGFYDVNAENISLEKAVENRGAQRFYGENSFEIRSGRTTNVNFTCQMVNARVSLTIDSTFRKVYKLNETTINVYESSYPERVINFPTSSTKDNNWAYFNIDNDPELIVNVETVRNDGQANNFTMKVTLKPQYWHNLVLATTTTDGYASIEIMVDETMIEQEENWGVEPY